MSICKIPYDFIRQRTRLRWAEVVFGVENQLIDMEAAVAMAIERSEDGAEELKMLASNPPKDSAMLLVSILASAEQAPDMGELKAKWLYLLLAWVYESHAKLVNPFVLLEHIYLQFDCPEQMKPFVPSARENKDQDEKQMLAKWKEYLERTSARYG